MPALRTPPTAFLHRHAALVERGQRRVPHMSRRPVLSSAVAGLVALATFSAAPVSPASAAEPRSEAAADRAVSYVVTQQQPSGGFRSDTSSAGQFVRREPVR